MKKIVFAFVLVALSASTINAQNLGVRIGWGGELSYQHPFGEKNRLELDLGMYSFEGGFSLAGVYHWVNQLQGDFNWYIGVGAGIGSWEDHFRLSALGQFGVEYNFPGAPFQISLDWRPGLLIVPEIGFWSSSIGLGIRYRFGK